ETKKTLRRKVFERNGFFAYVSPGAGSPPARGAKPRPRCGRESLRAGYVRHRPGSRDLPLGQVEDGGVDLLEPLAGERPAVRACHVAQHPLLALGMDEIQPAGFLVVLQLLHEPKTDCDRLP